MATSGPLRLKQTSVTSAAQPLSSLMMGLRHRMSSASRVKRHWRSGGPPTLAAPWADLPDLISGHGVLAVACSPSTGAVASRAGEEWRGSRVGHMRWWGCGGVWNSGSSGLLPPGDWTFANTTLRFLRGTERLHPNIPECLRGCSENTVREQRGGR